MDRRTKRRRSVKDAVSVARQLYKRNKLALALQLLDTHMDSRGWHRGVTRRISDVKFPLNCVSKSDIFAMHDLRALLLEKSGDFEHAKCDAVVMIALFPKDPRGYLRLGKLYILGNRYDRASTVYSQGLSKVPRNDPGFELLTRLNRKAAEKVMDKSRGKRDPVSLLPAEILYMIFRHLQFRQIVALMSVSRKWQHYICSESRFWFHVDLENSSPHVLPSNIVMAYCARAGPELKLSLGNVNVAPKEDFFRNLLQKYGHKLVEFSSNLRSRTMNSLFVKYLGILNPRLSKLKIVSIHSSDISGDLKSLLALLPSLEELELHESASARYPRTSDLPANIPQNLRSLVIVGVAGRPSITEELAKKLAGLALPNLHLHRCIDRFAPTLLEALNNECLETFGFTSSCIRSRQNPIQMPRFAGRLTRLTLNNVCLDATVGLPQQHLPLQYLELKWFEAPAYSLGEILESLGCAATLETLVIHGSYFHEPIICGPRLIPNLKTFQLTRMAGVDDRSLDYYLKSMPYLRNANFDDSRINGSSLVKFVKNGVKHLRCRGCPLSIDTLEWLKTQKVYVSYNNDLPR